jgi:hypothetical protein
MLVPWLLLAASVATQAAPIGQVTSSLDAVEIHRGERTYRAGIDSALYPGDRVSTGPNGVSVLFLHAGQTLYVGSAASLRLGSSPADRVMQLDRGEIRATADGRSPLTLAAGPGRATVGRGIVRASATDGGLRLWAEQGSAEVVRPAAAPLRLNEGQEVLVPRSGAVQGPVAAKDQGWSLRVEDVQLAAAAAASRRLIGRRVNDANNALAADITPSGQLRPEAPEGAARPEGVTEEAARPGAPPTPEAIQPEQAQPAYQPVVLAQPNTGVTSTAISLALGGISASQAGGVSGGLFSDAQQDSRNLAFPGNIHLITAQSTYTLKDVRLRPSDMFPAIREYWSIGLGAPATQQVVTTFQTGSNLIPQTLRIPKFDAYLVQLSQFGIPDPASNPTSQAGIAGLLGPVPVAPQVRGAVPLTDPRAHFNNRATFALGELALDRSTTGSTINPVLDIRRSDQDRQIIKAPNGNDNNDKITPNPDVKVFLNVPDPKFFPELASVKVPAKDSIRPLPTYRSLDLLRKAAVTTLLADALSGYVKRTGQTRFVVDRQVIDITGYRKAPAPNPLLFSAASPYGHDVRRPMEVNRHHHR